MDPNTETFNVTLIAPAKVQGGFKRAGDVVTVNAAELAHLTAAGVVASVATPIEVTFSSKAIGNVVLPDDAVKVFQEEIDQYRALHDEQLKEIADLQERLEKAEALLSAAEERASKAEEGWSNSQNKNAELLDELRKAKAPDALQEDPPGAAPKPAEKTSSKTKG